MPRSPLLHGLSVTVRNPRPLVWTYVFNLATAWIAAAALRSQFSEVTRNSLAANRLIYGFDLSAVAEAGQRISMGPRGSSAAAMLGTPAYLLLFFLLVPGTLLAYQTGVSRSLGSLLYTGVHAFWSFVRITLLTVLVAVPVIGVAGAAEGAWAGYLDRNVVGEMGFVLQMAGAFVVFLVASVVRLYFDLVEVHTVALSETLRPSGRPDRRVRKTLLPAFRNLRVRFVSHFLTFVLLSLAGAAAMYFLGLSALHHLAQPRSWPVFMLAQLGLFLMLLARFWQRGAETVMVQNFFPVEVRSNVFITPDAAANPLAAPRLERRMNAYASSLPMPSPFSDPLSPVLPGPEPLPEPGPVTDPIPDPEPISPSLASPDPGVYHHDVGVPELDGTAPPEKDLIN